MSKKKQGYTGNKGLEYYRAYPRDFFEGSVGLDGPMRGFYRMVIDLIYMHDGFLLDDWGHISGNTGFSKIKCKRMMNTLIAKGKIHVLQENEKFFTQKRTEIELKDSRKFQEKQSKNIAARWKNNRLAEDVVIPPQDHKTTIQGKPAVSCQKDQSQNLQLFDMQIPKSDPIKDAYNAYNAMAVDAGLPEAIKLSQKRKASIKARLKDVGGLDGWSKLLQKVSASPHCTGQNNRGWKADLDFIITESKFINIIEGKYDGPKFNNGNGGSPNGGGMAGGGTAEEIADRATRYANRRAAGG